MKYFSLRNLKYKFTAINIFAMINDEHSQDEQIRKLRSILHALVTFAGLLYLIYVLFAGLQQDKRLGNIEAAIFTVILVFNSDLIARIKNFEASSGGVKFTLDEVKETAKQAAKDEVVTVKKEQEKQEEILSFLILLTALIEQKEANHLRNLKYLDTGNARKYRVTEAVKAELRKLVKLGFIRKLGQATIGGIPTDRRVDLTEYVEITPAGEKYLELDEIQRQLAKKEEEKALEDKPEPSTTDNTSTIKG